MQPAQAPPGGAAAKKGRKPPTTNLRAYTKKRSRLPTELLLGAN